MYKIYEKTKNIFDKNCDDTICSNCKSINIQEDVIRGCSVCVDCGLVIVETLMSYKQKPMYENKSKDVEQNSVLNKIYKPIPIIPKDVIKLEPKNRKEYIRIIKSGNNYNTQERKDIELSEYFSTITSDLGLSWNFYQSCMHIYFKLSKTGFLKNKLNLLIVCGIIMMVSYQTKKPINLKILVDMVNERYQPRKNITKGKVAKFKETLLHVLKESNNKNKQNLMCNRLTSFTDQINSDIELIRKDGKYEELMIDKLQLLSHKLQSYFEKKNIYGSKRNYPIGIIYLSSKLLDMKMKLTYLSGICKTCDITIRDYYNELSFFLPEKYKKLL